MAALACHLAVIVGRHHPETACHRSDQSVAALVGGIFIAMRHSPVDHHEMARTRAVDIHRHHLALGIERYGRFLEPAAVVEHHADVAVQARHYVGISVVVNVHYAEFLLVPCAKVVLFSLEPLAGRQKGGPFRTVDYVVESYPFGNFAASVRRADIAVDVGKIVALHLQAAVRAHGTAVLVIILVDVAPALAASLRVVVEYRVLLSAHRARLRHPPLHRHLPLLADTRACRRIEQVDQSVAVHIDGIDPCQNVVVSSKIVIAHRIIREKRFLSAVLRNRIHRGATAANLAQLVASVAVEIRRREKGSVAELNPFA